MTLQGKTWDLVVIGGGVVGLAVARDARGRGMEVIVLERGRPGREASWAAAGMLSPLGEAREGGPFLEFGLEALRAWPGWARELEDESGIDLEYRRSGKLRVALTEEELLDLEARGAWAAERNVGHRRLDADEAARQCRGLASHVRGALLLEEDHQLENRLLGEALAASGRARGVEIRDGSGARAVQITRGRVQGVVLDDGTELGAGAVLVAAGAWSGNLEGLPSPLPVRPVRGQILALLPEELPSGRIVESSRVYLVPRVDGRLVVGATQEEVGFKPGLTADGVRGLLAGATELVPALASASLQELWFGFRPGTPDGHPILGPDAHVEGLFLATGHFRNGILLAPVTARALGALLAGQEGPGIPEAFLPGRFPQGTVTERGEERAFAGRRKARD